MAPKFGTSGLRGLVVELTSELVADYVRAFVAACDHGGVLCVGQDLRSSSSRIASDIISAARCEGLRVIDCGALPTPALALAAQEVGASAIMVTGSHIPADRNGLKFYVRKGEITKADEVAISAALGRSPGTEKGALELDYKASTRFIARYVNAFGRGALSGKRIGLYAHSAVGRDDLRAVLEGLGADVVELGRSDTFVPVDTEAVDPETRARIRAWVTEHELDALVSTDGDSDRPLLADETGTVVPGDILGQITAEELGAEAIVTPISSNSGVNLKGFNTVVTTRIGSPYVISAMEVTGGKVVGYEANGGFLLGFVANMAAGQVAPLKTRDFMLPIIAVLVAAGTGTVSQRLAKEPAVVTMADLLRETPQEASRIFISQLHEPAARADFLARLGASERACDLTDGVRMALRDGRTLHVRPSGNAPELRVYVEASDKAGGVALMEAALAELESVRSFV